MRVVFAAEEFSAAPPLPSFVLGSGFCALRYSAGKQSCNAKTDVVTTTRLNDRSIFMPIIRSNRTPDAGACQVDELAQVYRLHRRNALTRRIPGSILTAMPSKIGLAAVL